MKKHLVRLPVLFAVLVTACSSGGDGHKADSGARTADLKAVYGDYSGFLIGQNGKTLGALHVSLGESKETKSPVAVKLRFLANSSNEIATKNVSFVPSTGDLRFNVLLDRSRNVFFEGNLKDAAITGSLRAEDHDGEAASFVLKTNDEAVSRGLPQSTADDFATLVFGGQISFDVSRTTHPVVMTLSSAKSTDQENLLADLTSIRKMNVVLSDGRGGRLSFQNALLNTANGKLVGSTKIGAEKSDLAIGCSISSNRRDADCRFELAEGETEVAAARLASLATAPDEKPAQTTPALHRSFDGEAAYEAGKSTKVSLTIDVKATNPARAFAELFQPSLEKIVKLVYLNAEQGAGVEFPQAKWNPARGTLEGTVDLILSRTRVTVSISCADFSPETSASKFDCKYSSSLRSSDVPARFVIP